MLDQSHNVTDPIESLMTSAIEMQRAFAQALLVEREALAGYQQDNDALQAAQTLKRPSAPTSGRSWRARPDEGRGHRSGRGLSRGSYRAKVAEKRPAVARSGSGHRLG